MIYVGIDNGTTSNGIGVVTESGESFLFKTPVKKEQSYTKIEKNISRIDHQKMFKIFDDLVAKFSKETYLKWYKDMLLIRRFEEKTGQLYIQQKFGGFCHLYIGQEAIVAGCEAVLRPEDKMITTYRDHAHPIGRGTEPKFIMAELYGKITGVSKGKGGSMHMFDKSHNFFGGHGIVGAHIPMGAGIAFADKYNGNKAVTICFMGDGAVRQGSLHETLNLATPLKGNGVINLMPFMIELNLFEDLYSSTISGEIVLQDVLGLISGYTFNGTEFLEVP